MHTKIIDFSKYSSFKIGGKHTVTFLHKDMKDISEYYLIGSCNNILMGDNPPKLMMLSKEYDYIRIENEQLIIGGATPSGKIASFCKKHNIANFEFVSHLPGKLGGLIFMNAGLKEYEIFNNLLHVTLLSGVKQKHEISYGYRYTNIDEPILEAAFSLQYGFNKEKVAMFKKMRSNQPATPSAGSCFKNPQGDYAGRLIEAVGLKGVRQGDMCFSDAHANFLVNNGRGNYKDALYLIEEAKRRVKAAFDIDLECEIVILDKAFL
jgi:UDP-N-acetylmuramate dehydrogenase